MGKPTGNWINDDVLYAIEWPEFPRNVEKGQAASPRGGLSERVRRRLGHAIPAFYSRGERIIAQLREVASRQAPDHGAGHLQRLQGGSRSGPAFR